jgi:hypothetical protein
MPAGASAQMQTCTLISALCCCCGSWQATGGAFQGYAGPANAVPQQLTNSIKLAVQTGPTPLPEEPVQPTAGNSHAVGRSNAR